MIEIETMTRDAQVKKGQKNMAEERKQRAVTQTDIARELNISVVSVSTALNGRKGVSDELRQRILDMAEELGYEGPAGQSQKKDALVRIGVLISQRYLRYTPSFYMKVYQEIVIAAQEKKSTTFLEILDPEDEESLKLPKLSLDDQVNGILVLGELSRAYTEAIRNESRAPVIFVDYYQPIGEADFITSDGYAGAYRLTKMMLAVGYRKIAFVGTLQATSSIRDRFFGYRKALMESGIEVRPEWIVPDRSTSNVGIFVQLPEEMPEAFLCNCDVTAAFLIEKLRQDGYRVPEDVGVAGFDHFLMEQIDGVELTTYDVNIEAMAKISVNTLIRKINQTHFVPRMSVVTGKVIRGNSF